MADIPINELQIHTRSLDMTHLSHAIDLVRMATPNLEKRSGYPGEFAKRLSISSIIHSFAGLESVVNFFGYELFFNEDSPRFVPREQREFLLVKMIKSWDTAPFIEKLSFIVFYAAKKQLPPKLENQLRELNNLRNWLVHGFSYKSTWLIDPTPNERGAHDVVDMEDSVDWAQKFPNTKFNPLHELNTFDARLALTIIFDGLKLLSDCMKQPFLIVTYMPEVKAHVFFEDKFNIQDLIAED